MQTANQRDAVHHAGHAREMFADADARHGGGDRAILAANLLRRIGLGIEGIEVARAAVEEDQDAGADRLGMGWGCPGERLPRVGQPEAQRAAKLEQVPARNGGERVHDGVRSMQGPMNGL